MSQTQSPTLPSAPPVPPSAPDNAFLSPPVKPKRWQSRLLRASLYTLGLAAVVVGTGYTTTPDLVSTLTEMDRLAAQSSQLDARLPAYRERQEAKSQVAEEVVRGRLGLLEAAARFRDLNAADPWLVEAMRTQHSGMSYEESLCRSVLKYVRPRQPELARGLEVELHKHVKDGKLRLPG